ncbi:MAG: hypothetical protein A3H37_07960 [Candidatus Schekmanbacteria bacterium RIFCSPLOWO2_02_FULL_38_14]|nr:MAG: hypothetical protein A3H37_07960 [Candidatus Schekmanbacteria bacterium RIFCSPLOWO2_02_FULL_38_14]
MLRKFPAVLSLILLILTGCISSLKDRNGKIAGELKTVPAKEGKQELNPYLGGLDYYKRNEFDKAVREFEKAITDFPEIKDYSLYYLFKIAEYRYDYDECRRIYGVLFNEFPKSRWVEECMYEMGNILFANMKWEEARGIFNEFNRKFPVSNFIASSYYRIGLSYVYIGENDKGKEIFNYLWINYPLSRESREAEKFLKDAYKTESIESMFRTSELLIRADKFYDARKFDETLSISRFILNSNAERQYKLDVMRKMAECYERMKKYLNAVSSYKKLIEEIEKENDRIRLPLIYYKFARACYQINYKEGFEWVKKKLIEKFPDSEFVKDMLYTAGRYYEDEKNFNEAIESFNEVLKKDKDSAYTDDVLWHIGWVYYLKGGLSESAEYFLKERENFKNSESINKSIYWCYKSLEKNKDRDRAVDVLKDSIKDYQSYYWLLCNYKIKNKDVFYDYNPSRFERYGRNINDGSDKSKTKEISLDVWNEIIRKMTSDGARDFIKRAMVLWRIGLADDSIAELKYAKKTIQKNDRESLISLAEILWMTGNYTIPIKILSNMSGSLSEETNLMAVKLNEIFYPAAYWDIVYKYSMDNGIDPFLVLAIMRQESFFDPNSLSPAGAIGLLQIMPKTALKILKENGEDYFEKNQLYESETNILLGIKYISKLLLKYNNNLVFAIAAYNAGEHQVKEWQSRFPDRELDEFIESIPYPETKNYIKKVITNYENYYRIYSAEE